MEKTSITSGLGKTSLNRKANFKLFGDLIKSINKEAIVKEDELIVRMENLLFIYKINDPNKIYLSLDQSKIIEPITLKVIECETEEETMDRFVGLARAGGVKYGN